MGRAESGDRKHTRDGQNQLLAAIVESSHDAIISKDLNSRVTSWNRGAQLVFGYSAEEMVGESITRLIPSERQSEEDRIIERIRRGERIEHFETVRCRKDGRLINVSLTISPIRGAGGRIIGASKIARDITDRVKAEETQKLLMREVNHRSKNLLAVVEAMIRKTATSTPPAELVSRISQRLQALSAIQNLLIYSEWRGVDLATLARAQTAPYCDGRVEVSGPQVTLQPQAAQALGLAFHELATNALRHGVLTDPAGKISLSWTLDGGENDRRFSMLWRETGRPASPPERNSFGATILKRATEDALDGKVSVSHGAAGYSWRLDAGTAALSA